MTGLPYTSPRGRQHRQPFVKVVPLTRVVVAGGDFLRGREGGAVVRVVADPDRPGEWRLERWIKSAFTARRAPRRPTRAGLRAEADMLREWGFAVDAEAAE